MLRTIQVTLVLLILTVLSGTHFSQAQKPQPTPTQVVMLGTGTPLPDPERAGPSVAVVVNDNSYIVDAGAGLVRRAAAARDKGINALRPVNLKTVFLTHLHSDHTLGLPDLMITPWIMGRKEPLQVYGPPGTQAMVNHILEAYEVDRKIRVEGMEHSNNTGWRVNVHEITPGVVFKDAGVTVTAFAVRHGNVNAYGYRFVTPDRTIVMTGDTSPTDAIVENCRQCDVLIAEAYTKSSFDLIPPAWKQYRRAFHTSAQELGAIAARAKPGVLVLFHRGNAGCDQAGTEECRKTGSEEYLLKEMRQAYAGKVVAAHDLDVY
jgi:ribonuclease BN (tRNA processing enzyme)